MSDHISKTIEDAMIELKKREVAVNDMKKFVNQLCAFAGRDPLFTDTNNDNSLPDQGPLVKRNTFFGRALATCVREYLNSRAKRNTLVREANIDDIFGALQEGGFDFSKIEAKESDRKRVISIMIAKNPAFIRLPNSDIGLAEWYDDATKKRKAKAASGPDPDDQDVGDDAPSAGVEVGDVVVSEQADPVSGDKDNA